MGMTRDTNDILNRPPIAMTQKIDGNSFVSSTITQSATSTLTAISIQGPGVITFFTFVPFVSQRVWLRAIVDGQTAQSFSGTVSPSGVSSGLAVVGGSSWAYLGYEHFMHDPIPFEQNFSVVYQMPNYSLGPNVTIRYAYRLTE